MGIVRGTARTVAREAGYVAGVGGIKGWWNSIQESWLHTKRHCPNCAIGRMFPFTEQIDGDDRKFFGCSNCDHFEVADLGAEKDQYVEDSLKRLQAIAEARLNSLGAQELESRARRLCINSRLQFASSLALLAFGVYVLASGGAAWTMLNASALSGLLFAMGLRFSYRHWQLQNRAFYQPGSFRRWFGEGKWIV